MRDFSGQSYKSPFGNKFVKIFVSYEIITFVTIGIIQLTRDMRVCKKRKTEEKV